LILRLNLIDWLYILNQKFCVLLLNQVV